VEEKSQERESVWEKNKSTLLEISHFCYVNHITNIKLHGIEMSISELAIIEYHNKKEAKVFEALSKEEKETRNREIVKSQKEHRERMMYYSAP